MQSPSATSVPGHAVVTAAGAAPTRTILFLHGIYGSGANWRSFARRFVEAKPHWAALLVDLRMHGGSQGFASPHTVASAARDLDALDVLAPAPIAGIIGHSFGGKVALDFVRARSGDLDVAWTIDSCPGPRPTGRGSEHTLSVLRALEAAPSRVSKREEFVSALVGLGVSTELAPWLAMNLRPDGAGYVLRLDLGAIRALLADYLNIDLWSVLEHLPGRVRTHVVVGGKSNVFDQADTERLARVAESSGGRVVCHTLANAGHWVHVDDPEGLLRLVVDGTP